MEQEIKEGQIWRKEGPVGWIKIERIQDPEYPCEYDGGCHGVVVRLLPDQMKGIQCRGGKTRFMADSKDGGKWEDQVKNNRFPLKEGWKRGEPIYPF